MAMIELDNISITFNQGTPLASPLFQRLNLKIEKGEFVTVIGSNGAGKSSLLNLLAGELIVDEGRILVDALNVTPLATYERAKLISRVFQNPSQGSCSELTIEENLKLALQRGATRSLKFALTPCLRTEFRERLLELGMGLENRLEDPMGLLSGGQRQAINLVMATLTPSKILLLDEHTAALDPRMRAKVLELTSKLVDKYRLTTLMITHCMSQAFDLGTRTLVLHMGKILHDLKGDQRAGFRTQELLELF